MPRSNSREKYFAVLREFCAHWYYTNRERKPLTTENVFEYLADIFNAPYEVRMLQERFIDGLRNKSTADLKATADAVRSHLTPKRRGARRKMPMATLLPKPIEAMHELVQAGRTINHAAVEIASKRCKNGAEFEREKERLRKSYSRTYGLLKKLRP